MSDDLVTAEHLIRGLRENLGDLTLGPHLGVLLAEYDRRGEEIGRLRAALKLTHTEGTFANYARREQEALGLLRELAKYWVRLESDGKDWSKVHENLGLTARDLKQRIRVLVERAGPAGAHPAGSED